jgi:hypothetical protein
MRNDVVHSHVFRRRLDRDLPTAVRAEGVWIYDESGRKYLDASGGPICMNVGHGRTEVIQAIHRQLREFAYVHGTMFTSRPVEELAGRLVEHAPTGIELFYFCSSGSEAVETAIKLARQIHIASGRPERYRLIARWQSYHGATLGALSASGKPSMRDPFLPMLPSVIHIPPPYCLRCSYGLTPRSCGIRCAHALEEAVLQEGRNSISAFLAETICGATMGAVVPPPEYYRIISEICREHGILLILDEVMCGLGRTGKWFAAEHYGIAPDLIVLGKGLGGGYVPISAVGCRREHVESIRKHPGGFSHGHTYSHHAVAGACALAVLDLMEREDLVRQVESRGAYLEKILQPLRDHPHVADIRGIGLMWAVELVQDRDRLQPFPRSRKVAERLHDALIEKGVLTYKCTGFSGGDGDGLMLGPPFIISEQELDIAVDALKKVISENLK